MKLRPEPILIGLACFGPFVLAVLLYYGPVDEGALPVLENPERELIADARLPEIDLETAAGEPAEQPWVSYRWALIYVSRLPCEASCRTELERLEQVHDALGAERHRMRRLFLFAGDGRPEPADSALLVGALEAKRAEQWHALFGDALEPGGTGRFFVADPLGNLVVGYPAGADRSAMLEDIERLLDVSRIG